ncbi:MAG: murein hydrolase activator EnvC family protein [Thiohalocapsa sp.]
MIPRLEHVVELLGHDIDGRTRGLAETRREQALLLGEIEVVAQHPRQQLATLPPAPLDRIRAETLREAVAPALHAEAQALVAEITRVAALRHEIAARRSELEAARNDLPAEREHLAELVRQRAAALRRLLPSELLSAAQIARIGREAKGDVGDLVTRADAALDRADKDSARHGDDAAQPPQLPAFDPAAARLTTPVATAPQPQPGGAGDASEPASPPDQPDQRLTLPAPAAAVVVAPFAGRIVYAGAFGRLGLVLIIRHGRLYHSLLAGLGRVDLRVGDWVLTGEPVGVMPDRPGVALQFELRRDGRPVDPQPWLAAGGAVGDDRGAGRDEAPSEQDGDQKVGK